MKIQVAFFKEGLHWVGQALNVEVSSFGDTLEEAKSCIAEALSLYFDEHPDAPFLEIESALIDVVNVQVA